MLGNTAYNSIKWIALVFLPALGALYFGLGQLWDLPEVEKVVGSVTVVETFLGLLLRKAAGNYGSVNTIGDAIVKQDPVTGEAVGLSFVVDGSVRPAILEDKKIAMFNVKREQPAA